MPKHVLHCKACTRVPLVIAHPEFAPARTTHLASTVDLVPTLLDLAGAPPYHGIQGQTLVPMLGDPSAKVRDRVLIEEDEPENWAQSVHGLVSVALVCRMDEN